MLELLKKAIEGVLNQGCQSIKDGVCVYRAENGVKCALGYLIDDAHYTEDLEGETLSFLDTCDVAKAIEGSNDTTLDDVTVSYMQELQEIHDVCPEDDAEFVDTFKQKIRESIDGERLPKELLELVK